MRPISYKNSHANRTQINFGGAKRKVKIAQVSSTQLSGNDWTLFVDVKKMTAVDGDTVSTYISQKGPNATTKAADPVYRGGGLNGPTISFNGSQALTFGINVIPAGVGMLSTFIAHSPAVIDPVANIIIEMGTPAYYSIHGMGLGIVGEENWAALSNNPNSKKGSETLSKPQVLSSRLDRNGADINARIKMYLNSEEETATTDVTAAITSATFDTGAATAITFGSRANLTIGYNGGISTLAITANSLTVKEHLTIDRTIMGRNKICG